MLENQLWKVFTLNQELCSVSLVYKMADSKWRRYVRQLQETRVRR